MGERLDELTDTGKDAGTVVLDSTTGVLQGFLLGAWPVILMSTVAVLTITLVKLPRRILAGSEA